MQKKIFILSPSKFTSGGPELLHQLCHELNNLGYNAFIHYVDAKSIHESVPLNYKIYNIRISEIEDSDNNILVIPESFPAYVVRFKKIRIFFWWLSVDNYFQTFKNYRVHFYKNIKFLERMLIKFKFKIAEPVIVEKLIYSSNIIHLVQSFYAKEYLSKKGLNSYFLTDYINDSFYNFQGDTIKLNFILFNPAKGLEFIKPYFDCEINAIWIPLQHMNKDNLIKLMKISKIYIDFGNHPGKDRIPREAAILGCCIITSKSGSAKNVFDLSIPNEFKFDPVIEKNEIVSKINMCLLNYDEENEKFNNYRNSILKEKSIFTKEIEFIFSEISSN